MTTALEGGEGSASCPGRSLTPGETRYPLYRRLGGPQGRSGQVRKISPPLGFDPRTVQPLSQSLYRLSYSAHHVKHTMLHIHVSLRMNPQGSKHVGDIRNWNQILNYKIVHFVGLCCVITRPVVLKLTPLRTKVCPVLKVHILHIFTYTIQILSKVHVRVLLK